MIAFCFIFQLNTFTPISTFIIYTTGTEHEETWTCYVHSTHLTQNETWTKKKKHTISYESSRVLIDIYISSRRILQAASLISVVFFYWRRSFSFSLFLFQFVCFAFSCFDVTWNVRSKKDAFKVHITNRSIADMNEQHSTVRCRSLIFFFYLYWRKESNFLELHRM